MGHAEKLNVFRRLADFFYGYDFFISYSRRPGANDPGGLIYAEELNSLLEDEGFKCFLDSHDYAMGDAWKGVGARKLKMTSQLILVASEGALDAPAVAREIHTFHHKSNGRIIPIDFGGTIRQRDPSKAIFQSLQDDILFLEEDPSKLASGPSDEIVARIKAGFHLRRQDSKRSRFFAALAVVFAIISVAAGVAGFMAHQNSLKAQQNEATANKNLIDSYTIQGQENLERKEYDRGAAFLAHAISKADETKHPEAADEALLRLSSLMSEGHFVTLESILNHPKPLREFRYSPSGQLLVTTTIDGSRFLWRRKESAEWTMIKTWPGPAPGKHSVSFSADEKTIAVASASEIRFHQTGTGETARESLSLATGIFEVYFTQDEKHFLVRLIGKNDWDPSKGETVIVKIADGEIVKRIAPVDELHKVRRDGRYALFDLTLVELTPPFSSRKLPLEFIGEAFFRGLGSELLLFDRAVPFIFNFENGTLAAISSERHYDQPLAREITRAMAEYHPDRAGEVMVVGQEYGLTGERFRNILTEIERTNPEDQGTGWGFRGFRTLPNRNLWMGHLGNRFVIEKGGESVEVWDKEAVTPVSAAIQHQGSVTGVAFSPDDREFATATGDGTLRIWNTALLRRPTTNDTLSLPVTTGRWLLPALFLFDNSLNHQDHKPLFEDRRHRITYENSMLRVRDPGSGEIIFGPIHPGGEVLSAAVSPDGHYLALGHMAESFGVASWATVWNLKTGDRVMRIEQGNSNNPKLLSTPTGEDHGTMGVVAVAFHPGSQKLATLSARSEGDGDRPFMGWELRRARVWNLEKKRPATGWITNHHGAKISRKDHERLNCTIEGSERYLQEVKMRFCESGETVQLLSAGERIQDWSWEKVPDKTLLLKSVDALSGIRYSEELGRLQPIADQERIRLWKTIRKSPAMLKFLKGNRGE